MVHAISGLWYMPSTACGTCNVKPVVHATSNLWYMQHSSLQYMQSEACGICNLKPVTNASLGIHQLCSPFCLGHIILALMDGKRSRQHLRSHLPRAKFRCLQVQRSGQCETQSVCVCVCDQRPECMSRPWYACYMPV